MPNIITQTLHRRIEPGEQRSLLRVPLQIPADIETLTIAYTYDRHRVEDLGGGKSARREINCIDIALENEAGMQVGASGGARGEITIHENYATPGYLPTPVTPGVWQVILGAYVVAPEGCDVELQITLRSKGVVLLRGDCHSHTEHSDGWYTVDALIERARQDQLDFLFITDHNSMSSNRLIRSYPDITVLPGAEATYYGGHFNFLGIERPMDGYFANGREQVLQIMQEGRRRGALTSLNHPIDSNCPWTFGFEAGEVPADLVEVWNGPFTQYNAGSVTMWHEQLCAGRRWPAIGGSDCHHDELMRIPGTPSTFLYARSRGGSDILEALRLGHAFIGMDKDAPRIHMNAGNAIMGDICENVENAKLELVVEELKAQDEVRLIDQTGVVWQGTPGACSRFEQTHPVRGSLFLRVEIRRSMPQLGLHTMASLSNPIYFPGNAGEKEAVR